MELKPCPFCGKPASFKVFTVMHTNSTIGWNFSVGCDTCRVFAPPDRSFKLEVNLDKDGEVTVTKDEREAAQNAWNQRSE